MVALWLIPPRLTRISILPVLSSCSLTISVIDSVFERSKGAGKTDDALFPHDFFTLSSSSGSFDDAIIFADEAGENEVFIIGGGKIFEQTLPLAGRIYLTHVLARLDCDTYFPEFNPGQWEILDEAYIPADENNEYDSIYQFLSRK